MTHMLLRYAEQLATDPHRVTASMYERTVEAQMQHLPTESRHVRGGPLKSYILLGVREEYGQTYEIDSGSDYSRTDRLITESGTPVPGETPETLSSHAKEFGDLSWYAVNFHRLFGGRLARSLVPAVRDVRFADVDILVRQKALRRPELWAESGRHYMAAADKLLTIAEEIISSDHAGTRAADMVRLRSELGRATGHLLVTTSLVLQSKLHTTLAATLSENAAKAGSVSGSTPFFALGSNKH